MEKRIAFAAILFLLFSIAFACADSSSQNNISSNHAGNGFAVVELFTSEGCSSCPPADNAVAKLLKEYSRNVYVLGYHVDYWDNLGWRDAFSSADYTRRQKNYARTLKSGIYTPQVIVNGEEQFVGSDENKLHTAINNDLKDNPQQHLKVSAKANNNTIDVSYQTNSTNNLNIALVQLSAETKVQRGEDHGATLHHVNIVRSFQTITLKHDTGNVSLNIPAALSAKDCEIIAFTQDANMKITSAANTNIQ